MTAREIYTIGHSTHPFEEFLGMLRSFGIEVLFDIRRLPGSRKFPQFDRENLETSLEAAGIHYVYSEDLGGRRRPKKDTKNTRWNNASFRGYADYMETEDFGNAVAKLEQAALKKRVVYMCSEAVWWRCHRSMVSDYLKAKGWTVWHIMALGKVQEHRYTAPANVVGSRVSYSDENN
jgi:uncharacterized protein (DUF488 family)